MIGCATAAHGQNAALDVAALDPGIRETVRRLRAAGFGTTDSGDGVTKLPDAAEVLAFPHVTIRCDLTRLVEETRRLHNLLTANWIAAEPVGRGPVWIQASYDPADDVATIMLAGVDDKSWPLP